MRIAKQINFPSHLLRKQGVESSFFLDFINLQVFNRKNKVATPV